MSARIAQDEPGAHAAIELARRLLAALEARDERAIDGLVHATYRDHAPAGPDGDLAGLRIVAEDFIVDGDRVVARVRVSAIQRGRRVEGDQVHIWRVAGDRLAEHWMAGDDLAATKPVAVRLERAVRQ